MRFRDSLAVALIALGWATLSAPIPAGQATGMIDFGEAPVAMAIADFDGDGLPDMVASNAGGLSIALGNTDDAFDPPTSFSPGTDARDLAALDLNGDPWMDLVAPDFAAGDLLVHLGSPTGFSPGTPYSVGGLPRSIAVADFNGDGFQDVVTGNQSTNDVSVLLSLGTGTLAPEIRLAVGAVPYDVTVADLNGDDSTDIATANIISNDLSILLGNGSGGFAPEIRALAGNGEAALVASDFDCDGIQDLAVANNGSADVSILIGNGDGTYGSATHYPVETSPNSITALDLEGDGIQDLAVSNGAEVIAFAGQGDGTFVTSVVDLPGTAPSFLTAGDINSGGLEDLAVANPSANRVELLIQDSRMASWTLPTGARPSKLAVADIDQDSHLDVISMNRLSDDASFFRGNGNGTFRPEIRFGNLNNPSGVVVSDLDGDQHLDVAFAAWNGAEVVVYFGSGNGAFPSSTSAPAAAGTCGLAVGDVNGDLEPDIVATQCNDDSVGVFLNNGNRTFLPSVSYAAGIYPVGVVLGDFNEDDDLDIAARLWGGDLSVMPGNGDGTFGPAVTHAVGFQGSPVVADFNHDDHLDLASDVGAGFGILFGNGDGTFLPLVPYDIDHSVVDIAVEDINNDGNLDLAIAGSSSSTPEVVALLGSPSGTFPFAIRMTEPGLSPVSIALGDFNEDGGADMVSGNWDAPGLKVWTAANAPEADAGNDQQLSCTSPSGAAVSLDGSGSTDTDSTPGTNDDIVQFDWLVDYPGTSCNFLGTGETLLTSLPVGDNAVSLLVRDTDGHAAVDVTIVSVTDSSPPTISLDSISETTLWPPDHRLIDVQTALSTGDDCSATAPVLLSIVSNEADDEVGDDDGTTAGDVQDADFGTSDLEFKLRAERSSAGGGRTYTVTYAATDGGGNQTTTSVDVTVPLLQNGTADPVEITVDETLSGTRVLWQAVTGAGFYNVIRGTLSNIVETPETIDLGPVLCIEAGSVDTSTAGFEDAAVPAGQEIFIYLVEYDDGTPSSYGSVDAAKPRSPGPGTCP